MNILLVLLLVLLLVVQSEGGKHMKWLKDKQIEIIIIITVLGILAIVLLPQVLEYYDFQLVTW